MTITLPEFEDHLGDVEFPLAVAVSGGADSLALLLLAHELAEKKGSYVVALTVDHQLRPESRGEATRVGEWAVAWGIRHVILEWVHDNPMSRLQERARKARYELLTEWCKQHQISTLILGHHQQDQEETFWLRLASGSGLDGLRGMKKRLVRNDVVFLRPFLGFSKEQIKKTLLAKKQEWIEDPSNQNSHFFRGRFRHFLQDEGLSSQRLFDVMKKLQVDSEFIQGALRQALETTVQLHEEGYITLNKEAFHKLHPALLGRLLSLLVQWFSGSDYPPRTTQISRIFEKIKEGSYFTSGRIYWIISAKEIFLFRESHAIQEQLVLSSLETRTLWDQRFWVDPELSQYVPRDIFIGSLGSNHELQKEIKSFIPKLAWPTLPALWEKGKVVAVPHLCYDLLSCEKDLRKFFSLKPLFHDSLRITI